MSKIPYLAPGCFGSATMFSETDAVCRVCQFRAECEPVHSRVREELCRRLGIAYEAPKSRRKNVEPIAVDPTKMVPTKKMQELLDRIDRSGLDIIGKLRAGINPFPASLKGLAIAAEFVLRLGRPVPRDMLVTAMMKATGWQQQTAEAQARIACQVLEHVGAIRMVDGAAHVAYKDN